MTKDEIKHLEIENPMDDSDQLNVDYPSMWDNKLNEDDLKVMLIFKGFLDSGGFSPTYKDIAKFFPHDKHISTLSANIKSLKELGYIHRHKISGRKTLTFMTERSEDEVIACEMNSYIGLKHMPRPSDEEIREEKRKERERKEREKKERERQGEDVDPMEVALLWNRKVESHGRVLNEIVRLGYGRILKIKETTREFFNSYEDWSIYFNKVLTTPFLCGKGDWGWKASFDWIIDSDKVARVMEGIYDRTKKDKEEEDDEEEVGGEWEESGVDYNTADDQEPNVLSFRK